jgi:phospholipase C
MFKRMAFMGLGLLVAGIVACAGHGSSPITPPAPASGKTAIHLSSGMGVPPGLIDHVIFIVQENRTPDFLFQGLRGADISDTALDWQGRRVHLHQVSLAGNYDPPHGHPNFLTDYNGGKMNGFNKGLKRGAEFLPFGYAPPSEVKPYHDMARQYVFADHMFQTNEGPSFAAHLYLVSGTATDRRLAPYLVADDPHNKITGGATSGGCDAPKAAFVVTIDPNDASPGPTPFPCFNPKVLTDLLDAKNVSWRYYQNNAGAGLWQAFDAVRHVRYGPDYANLVWPPQTVLSDIANNRLANVSWVIPSGTWSDHAGSHSVKGPAWVAAVVNAIGQSSYWKDSVIFVLWDDWGGWYDHVKPPLYNHYELGFRVPLIVISPYAKHGYVSKVQHEFGSILAFTEEAFGITKGSLGTTDVRADDLHDVFDFGQVPRTFVHIRAPRFRPTAWDYAHMGDEDP